MKEFRKLIICLITVITLICVVDSLAGKILDRFSHEYGNLDFRRARNNDADIAIIGASVAFNNYNSQILSDSLNVKVYNYGFGGQSIYYHYCILHYLLDLSEYRPRIVIFNPCYIDIADAPGWNTEKISTLYFDYSNDSTIKEVIGLEDEKEKKLLSVIKLYHHNSQIPDYVRNYIRRNVKTDGFMPLHGIWDQPLQDNVNTGLSIDPQKLIYFKKMIELCKNKDVPLYIITAPVFLQYFKEEPWQYEINNIAQQNGIPTMDYSADPIFLQHPEWFYNTTHLNEDGAEIFSKKLSHDLKYQIGF